MSRSNNNMVIAGLAAAASVSLIFYLVSQQQEQKGASGKTVASEKRSPEAKTVDSQETKSRGVDASAADSSSSTGASESASGTTTPPPRSEPDTDKTPKVKNTMSKSDEKDLHAQIEALDKKGKVLFKAKQVRTCRLDVIIPLRMIGYLCVVVMGVSARRELSAVLYFMRSPYSIHFSSLSRLFYHLPT
jgi:hypothetical protein